MMILCTWRSEKPCFEEARRIKSAPGVSWNLDFLLGGSRHVPSILATYCTCAHPIFREALGVLMVQMAK